MNEQNQNGDIKSLAASIISGYQKSSGQEISCPDHLPDKTDIIEIIEILRRILFPGYFDKGAANMAHMEYHVGNLLIQAEKMLQQQICRALNHNTAWSENCQTMFQRSCELTRIFLNKIPELRETLLTDIQAAFDGDPAACDEHEIIFAYPGIFAVSVFRLAHELYLLSIPLIPRIMTEYAHSLTGIDIHPGAEISHHFFIDHGTGIVIGETTEIGAHVKLYQGVTLGALSTRGGQNLRGKKRHPTLENEVTVYSSTSILGGETVIGKGSVVGSNVFITQSIPPNTRVSMKSPELDLRGMN